MAFSSSSLGSSAVASELGKLLDAVQFAAVKHSTQRRKDPEQTPYINHPIGVAHILWSEGGVTDLATLQAAVLHDTVEDTQTTLDEVEERFGTEVRNIVNEVSDDKSLPKMERKRQQILHVASCSPKAKLVKLGDKLYNLQDLTRSTPQGWSEDRVQEYYHWSAQVVKGVLGSNDTLEKRIEQILKTRGLSLYD